MNIRTTDNNLRIGLSGQFGFTLIELSVVMVIVGIIISIMATVLPSLIQAGKIKKARAVLEKNDITLMGYVSATGRFPCPDTTGDGLENRNDGGTQGDPSDDTCDRYVGNLPYLTLNMSSADDVWHQAMKYAVYEDLTRTTTQSGSNPFCTAVDTIIRYYDPQGDNNPPDTSKLYVTDAGGQNAKNMAFVVISGGSKDLDGDHTDSRFDGLNEGQDLQFDSPERVEYHGDPVGRRYDDLLRTASFTYLKGYVGCVGMGGGGGGGGGGSGTTAGENTFPDGCLNALDDDGDGYTDCDDQDCFGEASCGQGGSDLAITTTALPSGALNSGFSATLQATGGQTPYEWTLTDDGGLELFLHTYTGQLSGTLDQCPGSHTIQVQVQDATPVSDGGPKTAAKAYGIQVTKDLTVSRTSGSGVDITWDEAGQQETFKANGGRLGNTTWQLVTGGAPGFSAISTGADTCVIEHQGTIAGSYNFTLTAVDASCPDNTADITFNVNVTSAGALVPIPESVVSQWKMDECEWDGTTGEVEDAQGSTDGTAKNGANTVGFGKICRGGLFDGQNDFVDMGDAFNDVFGTSSSSFTVVAWINPHALSSKKSNHNIRNIFMAKASDKNNDNFELGVNTNGKLQLYIDTKNRNKSADLGAAGSIEVGKWTFIAVSYDSGTVTATINDTKTVNSSTWSNGGNLDDATGSLFTLGSTQNRDTYFNGRLDEVFVFSEALSDSDINELRDLSRSTCLGTCYIDPVAQYNMDESAWSGTGTVADVTDSSGNGYNGTSFFGANTTADGKLCRGGAFTDSGVAVNNDRVGLPNQVADGLEDFTFAVWVKSAKTGQQGVVSGAASNSQNNEFLLFFNNSSEIRTYLKNKNKSYSGTVADNSFHHVAWMRDGTTESLTLDGETLGTNTVNGSAISIAVNGLWLGSEQDTVGGGWASSQEFVGTMDEVQFYDRALSESEIKAIIEATRSCN